jgi:hypothetical protein
MDVQLVNWCESSISDAPHLARDSARAFNKSIKGLPRNFARQITREFAEKYHTYNVKTAFNYLRERTSRANKILKKYPLGNAALYREDSRDKLAAGIAAECYEMLQDAPINSDSYYEKILEKFTQLSGMASRYGIAPPAINIEVELTIEAAILRLVCPKWWLKKFNVQASQYRELIQIGAKRVNNKCPYVSFDALLDFRARCRATEDFLNSFEVVCEETDQTILLADMAAKSTANPELRRVELMVRLRGLEDLANEKGQKAYFITWTAPSKWHGSSSKWNYSDPKAAQAYLCKQWSKARAKLARKEIEFSGARITEPHKDGCPHWHMLFFVSPDNSEAALKILKKYAIQHDKKEVEGHEERRFDVKLVDPKEGSAVGYIAKYIAKNINGKGLEGKKAYGTEFTIEDAAERVRAWASLWNIRQFQFFGAAKVSVWRELRRLKNPKLTGVLAEIHHAASRKDAKWSEFQSLCAGQSISLEYEVEEMAGEYGNDVARVVGVALNDSVTMTRLLTWVKRLVGGEAIEGGSPSWSPVNNCTLEAGSVETGLKKLGYDSDHIKVLASGRRLTFDGLYYFQIIDNELRRTKNEDLRSAR